MNPPLQQFVAVALPIMVTLVATIWISSWSQNKRFDDVNRRLDDFGKRFDDFNKRFDELKGDMNRRFDKSKNVSTESNSSWTITNKGSSGSKSEPHPYIGNPGYDTSRTEQAIQH